MKEVAELIKNGAVVAFCGAGLSAESGIPTFRGKAGLWEKYDPNLYVTASGIQSLFLNQPAKLKNFIVECYELMLDAKPNEAHLALSELERKGYITGIITQNIDDFHFQAGSKNVAQVHGNAYTLECPSCGFSIKKEKAQWRALINKLKDTDSDKKIIATMLKFLGKCRMCNHRLESGIVLFEQSLPAAEVQKSYAYLDKAKVVLCIGTSGVVYPAASFPLYAKEKGAAIVTVNPQWSSLEAVSDFICRKSAVDFFKNLLLNL